MPINFPNNPTVQVPTNEFSPTSTPLSTENGVTYMWDGEKWVASASVLTGDYVKIIGDNMTGNLTLGTDESAPVITLNATNGSITAEGRIKSTSQGASDRSEFINSTGDGGIRVSGTGPGSVTSILLSNNYSDSVEDKWSIKLNGTGLGSGFTEDSLLFMALDGGTTTEFKQDGSANFAGDVKIGGTLPDAPNISLNADGVGVFKNVVQSGGNPAGAAQQGTRLTPVGAVLATRDDSNEQVFAGFTTGNSTATSYINADGSANFAGGATTINNEGGVVINRATYSTALAIQENGTAGAFIQTDGDAYFKQYVKIGNTYADPNITLYANGSAQFAGFVTGDRGFISNLPDNGSLTSFVTKLGAKDTSTIYGSGQISHYHPTSSDSGYLLTGSSDVGGPNILKYTIDTGGSIKIGGTLPNAPNITLNADGSALYKSNVIISNNEPDIPSSVSPKLGLGINGAMELVRLFAKPDTETGLGGPGGWGGSLAFNFKQDDSSAYEENIIFRRNGSASFAGTVTADNVTFSIGNGATLDVKRVGNALVALKAAAANATDFTSLKSAIATSLANL